MKFFTFITFFFYGVKYREALIYKAFWGINLGEMVEIKVLIYPLKIPLYYRVFSIMYAKQYTEHI